MAEEEGFDKQNSGSSKKTILIATIIFIQFIIAAVVVVYVIIPKVSGSNGEEEAEEKVAEERVRGQIYKISELAINPKGSMGRRFAVFEVALEMPDAEAVEKIKALHPFILDRYLTYLRTKTVKELSNHENLPGLKKELKNIANEEIGENLVMQIYFTRFVLE